jgi:hypothetical protein
MHGFIPEWAIGIFIMLMGIFARLGVKGFPQPDDPPFPRPARFIIFFCGLLVFLDGLRRSFL